MIKKNLLFVLLFSSVFFPQSNQLAVDNNGAVKYIPTYDRQGTLYFSVTHLADVLGINYFYNPKTEKIDLKFDDAVLKVTGKNPFLIVGNKQNEIVKVFQLPTSTYVMNGNIFIPAEYSIEALKAAAGQNITFVKPAKLIIKSDKVSPGIVSSKADIYDFAVDEKANGTLVRLKSHKKISTYNSFYNNGVLTIVLKNAVADEKALNKKFETGLVKEVKVKNENGSAQLLFTLSKEYTTSEVISASNSNDVLITIHNKIFSGSVEKDKNKSKWNFDVIVIDAGHGGHDGGALGVNGAKEKDINLGISLKLGKLIEENLKDVKVIYTRKTDKFVELYKRGKIANDNDGKLFISIHCNSTPKKPSNATGFEVYLLRPGRTQEAISIAERENSVIQYEENPERYQQLTDENFILVSMAHSSYMRYSEKLSEFLNKQFSGDLPLKSRGVKQAGFYVLVGASMPSVLIETGFLSNKKDADYLKSSKGQQQIAESIFNAVKNFKEHYQLAIDSDS